MAKRPTKSEKNAAAVEFNRLLWLARKAHRRLEKESAARDADHQAALAFARAHGWSWAELLLEASRLDWAAESSKALRLLDECERAVPDAWRGFLNFVRGTALSRMGDHQEAIEAYRKALDDPKFDTPGDAWYNLGIVHDAKGEHDEAIKAYRSAIGDPKFDPPGHAWNNLGTVLETKGEHGEAIKAYRQALDDPKLDTPGNAWYNLGNALYATGEHDEAIKAYRKAIGDPKYETPGDAWNNLGIVLAAKGELDEAIEAYRNATDDPRYDTPARTWTNLAQAYAAAGRQEEAEAAFEKALDSKDAHGGDHARARLGLQLLKAKIEPEALSPDDRAMAGKTAAGGPAAGKTAAGASTDEIEGGVIAAIQAAGDTQYEKYINKSDSKRNDTLSILRGWSSAVTLLEGSERRWRGGGYFLKWRGYGIVIDPGFDFLRNFHDAGYHGREIQAVVVSHNHPDHNSDVKDIDDLRYELFKRLAKSGGSGFQPYVLLWDQDTSGATKFGFERPKHQHEPVVLASGFPQPINLLKHPARIPICVTPFKVNHGSDVPHAMGMRVELLDEAGQPAVRIGYTADTAYFEDLHKHLADCDVLIAHISQPSIEELQDPSTLKEIHLGYRGTARLLSECKPKLALIGEFWAGFTDLRISLVKGLRQRSGMSAVLPAGLAMHLHLPSLEIECTECDQLTPFAQIRVAPPTDNFGSVAYLCPSCMIG